MKKFIIIDCINSENVAEIYTNNGKNALKQFRNRFTSTGIYEIHKRLNTWILSSTYGSYFIAKEAK